MLKDISGSGQELAAKLQESRLVLPDERVARFLKGHPLDLPDCLEPWFHDKVHDLVESPIQEERFRLDLVCIFPTLPGLESANSVKLRVALPVEKKR
jgi:hypothetical protein